MNISISIIIPLYNASSYITDCLNSIISQIEKSIEIIVVDDGSTDDSYQIVSMSFPEVTLLHQTNGGAASARNAGLKVAKGVYVMFVDADDFILDGSLRECLNATKTHRDLYYFNIYHYDGSSYSLVDTINDGNQKSIETDVLDYVSNLNKFPGSSCGKLYRRSLINEKNIFFYEGIQNEDIEFNFHYLQYVSNLEYIPIDLYAYRQNVGTSVTHQKKSKLVSDMFKIFNNYQLSKEKPKAWLRIFAYEYSTLYCHLSSICKTDRKSIDKEFIHYKYLLLHLKNKKIGIPIYILCSILGPYITSQLVYYFYIKVRS